MPNVTLRIGGMHCGSCVAHVEKAIRRAPGVSGVSVNLATERASVEFEDGAADLEQIKRAVARAGYEATEVAGGADRTDGADALSGVEDHGAHAVAGEEEVRTWRARAIVGVAVALPVAVLGMTVETTASALVQAVLTTFIQVYIGWLYYLGAWHALRHGRANMDTLVALGTTTAYAYSVYTLIDGGTHVYFDTAAVILALIAVGKWMEARAKGNASAAIRSLMELQPREATVVRDGSEQRIPVRDVVPGDTVLIRPGEKVPVDGEVLDGSTTVDQSMVTGESVPADKHPGDGLIGGTLNQTGAVRMRATKVGEDSVLAQIVELVQRAQGSKAKIQRFADTVAGYFVPVVLVIGALALVGWGLTGDWPRGVSAIIAVLIVACPCALGLATPTAIMVGTGLGAQRGILIKETLVLERAGKLDTVVLDKTGTLTTGKPRLTDAVPLDGDLDEHALLRLSASLERPSEHPLARAIVEHAEAHSIRLDDPEGFRSETGVGVRGRVDGRDLFIGRITETDLDDSARSRAESLEREGKTVLAVSADNRPIGLLALADTPKPGAEEAVAALKSLGVKVMMITGDNKTTAEAVARQVGIDDVIAEVMPQDKEAAVRNLQQQGRVVAMVGDGINDAPALAAADIGIAMGSGTDIAMDAGHVVLVGGDLASLPRAIRLSRATMRRIRTGLFWAFIYNIGLIPVAAAGLLNPMLAAAAMSLSSVSVVANALSLRWARF